MTGHALIYSRDTPRTRYFDPSFFRDASNVVTTGLRSGTIAPFAGSAAAVARASTSC